MKSKFKQGSEKAFDNSWNKRNEAKYIHWRKNKPKNQIQLAFRSHFNYFSSIHGNLEEYTYTPRALEVGCGRGSLSAHYAEAGWNCSLLDTSLKAIDFAKNIFRANNLKAFFEIGNAENLPFENNSFDVVTSIGLLEHFDDPSKVISEKIRTAKQGGWVINYIVPKNDPSIQKLFKPFNNILSFLIKSKKIGSKEEVYRTSNGINDYLKFIPTEKVSQIIFSGTYPLPMISPSKEFPFTLCPSFIEFINVKLMNCFLLLRRIFFKKHYWSCNEEYGQAIVIALKKK